MKKGKSVANTHDIRFPYEKYQDNLASSVKHSKQSSSRKPNAQMKNSWIDKE